MTLPIFAAFQSTVTYFADRIVAAGDRWLTHPVTGAVVGIKNQNSNGADARFVPVDLTAAQIAAPTALMLADLDAVYRLNVAPYTRYVSNGTSLAAVSGAVKTGSFTLRAPLPGDPETLYAADTPADGALTLLGQPIYARKLQIDIVIGTPATTDITDGTLTLIGTDIDGNTIGQVISLVTDADVNIVTGYAFASLISATIADYAADGSGTGNTISIGDTNAFGMPTGQSAVYSFDVLKISMAETTVTGAVTGWAVVATDDDVGSATVDATARTVIPDSLPVADGLRDFVITYSYQN
jgi:hypothetical protein